MFFVVIFLSLSFLDFGLFAMKRSKETESSIEQSKKPKVNSVIQKLIKAIREGKKELIIELLEAHKASSGSRVGIKEVALFIALEEKREDIIKLVLTKGAECNVCSNDGDTPLHKAAKNASGSIVKLLLEKGAQVNAVNLQGNTPLLGMIECGGTYEAAEILLKAGADVNTKDFSSSTTALMKAVLERDEEWVALLLRYGADIHSMNKMHETALTLAENEHKLLHLNPLAQSMHVNVTGETVFKNEKRFKEWHRVKERIALYDDSEFITEILHLLRTCCTELGADMYRSNPISYINWHIEHCFKQGLYVRTCQISPSMHYMQCKRLSEVDHRLCVHRTVLMLATMFGDAKGLKKILAYDLPLWYLNAQDKNGRTALMYAILYRHTDIVPLLIQAYEKKVQDIVNLSSVEQGHDKKNALLEELKKVKRAINIADNKLYSALTYAIKKGDIKLVGRLVKAGARPTLQCIKQAALCGYSELATRLLMSFAYDKDGIKYALML